MLGIAGMLGILEKLVMLGMLGDAENAWNAGMSGGGVHWAEGLGYIESENHDCVIRKRKLYAGHTIQK